MDFVKINQRLKEDAVKVVRLSGRWFKKETPRKEEGE